jgi:hypothetical protein
MGKLLERTKIDRFDKLEHVQQWHDANPNVRQATKYKRKLQIICNTLEIKPNKLINEEPIATMKETLAKFTKAVDSGKLVHTHQNKQNHISDFSEYEIAIRSFVGHFHFIPANTRVLPKNDMRTYPIEMNDGEISTLFAHLSTYKDGRFLTLAALQHEIFCRFHALLDWDVSGVQIEEDMVDGIKIRYAKIPRFYEPKQKKNWEKLILNPYIVKMIERLEPDQVIVQKDEQEAFTKKYITALRKSYSVLGKIDLRKKYVLGNEKWYWVNHPTHCLRKSGSAQSLRRCQYNYSLVAAMGWNTETILRKDYAQPKVMLNQNICEYCNPAGMKQKNDRFCCYEHYLAYQYNGNKAKRQETREELLAKLNALEN